MHARLARIDPASATRIHPNDPQRIERALEVHALTGRAMSDLLAGGRRGGLVGPVCRIVIEPADRSVLHRDIAARFMRMLDDGLIDEVRDLRRRWLLTERSASMRLVGYRQVWAYLEGRCSREEMTARAIAATRQLARRQLTWLRSDPAAVRVDCHAPDAAERVAACVASFVERAGACDSPAAAGSAGTDGRLEHVSLVPGFGHHEVGEGAAAIDPHVPCAARRRGRDAGGRGHADRGAMPFLRSSSTA